MIRDIESTDAPAIARFLKGLGYNTSEPVLVSRLALFNETDDYKGMIDIEEDTINGIIGLQMISPLHTKTKVGRITTLVIDESYRGNRAGKLLVEAADEFFQAAGCATSEVTGAIMRSSAHKIFKSIGYVEGERQFAKRFSGRS